jgi:hypothetical protein
MPLVKLRKNPRAIQPTHAPLRFFSWPIILSVIVGLFVAGWCAWELANSVMITASQQP